VRLAVTGATGFVGGAVCRAAVDAGWSVLALGRRPAMDSAHIGGAPYRRWDITAGPLPDPPAVDAVVHCAASATDTGVEREVWATNLTGTRHVLRSFGAARMVHVSTASVYDPYRPTIMAVESEAPVHRYLNAYGASKAAAERAVLAESDREAIVLRPHAVYGPGDTTLLPRLLENVRAGRLLAVGDGRVLLSVTSVGNLVSACLLAASGPAARGVFNIADDGVLTVDQGLRGLLASAGVQARPCYLPTRLAWPTATVLESAQRLVGRPARLRLNRYLISQFAMERTLDISAARRHLGYRPTGIDFTAISPVPAG
jgi:2-alkyl-3-oxoalkanoate reductase